MLFILWWILNRRCETGYKYALEHDYDAVQFDGDGQHDIESLSDLLEPIRKWSRSSNWFSLVKRWVWNFNDLYVRRFGIGVLDLDNWQRVLDTTSGYRLADKAVIKQFARRHPIKYPDSEIVHILKRKYKAGGKAHKTTVQGVSSITPIKLRLLYDWSMFIHLIAAFIRESE